MKLSPVAALATLLLSAVATAAGWSWLESGPGREIAERGPFPAEEIPVFRPALPGVLTPGEGLPAEDLEGSWPCFRGPWWDGVSDEEVALAESWPEEGPPRRWSIPVGEGYAGPAIHRGRVYLLDYDEGRVDGEVIPERRGDVLRCLSLADGREIWRRWYHVPISRYHGISRTVPAVSDRHVVTLGPLGQVLCVDAESGEALWSMDLVADYGARIPEWYAGQCPRIDVLDDREVAILAPGGDRGALMMAVDCETGEVVWETPNPRELHMTHSSIAWMEWQGAPTYVYCTTGGAVGVDATNGSLLWEYPEWIISPAIVPTPVLLDGTRLLLCGGYKAGGLILEIREDERFRPSPSVVGRMDVRTFGAEQQTPIYYDELVFGVLTKNAGPRKEQLTCLSAEGAVLWSSGPERLFELGPFIVADGKLLLMDDDGVLTLVRTSAEAYEELARAKVLEGHESWAPMAIAGGLLLVRDLHTMACLDLSGEGVR